MRQYILLLSSSDGENTFVSITAEGLYNIHKAILGGGSRPTNVDGAFASIDYYDTAEMKIASVTRAIIKNHYFPDGNKRTATITYSTICYLNGITPKQDIGEDIEDIAKNQYSVEQVKGILF